MTSGEISHLFSRRFFQIHAMQDRKILLVITYRPIRFTLSIVLFIYPMHCCCSRMPIVIVTTDISLSSCIKFVFGSSLISVKFVSNTIEGTGKDGCDEWYLDGESKFK